MLTIIHGDDTVSSRKILNEERVKEVDTEVIRLDGNKITLAELTVLSQTSSLFESKRVIIIENLLAGAASKQKEAIFSYLAKLTSPTIIIWEKEEIGKSILNKYFSKAKIITCQPPALIFKFVENLGAGSTADTLLLFRKVLTQAEAEFVFVMILRQWRHLLIAKDLGQKGLSFLSPWQSRKFMAQARYFTLEQLISSYRNLLAIDYKLKTGKIPYKLSELIDIFLVNL
jgi:DNA polymerase III delta subunit